MLKLKRRTMCKFLTENRGKVVNPDVSVHMANVGQSNKMCDSG